MAHGITCIKNSLGDNFSYVAEDVAAPRLTFTQKVFIACLIMTCDVETSHKKRHHLTVSLAFCFSQMSDKTAA
jgi:hypothetical protein